MEMTDTQLQTKSPELESALKEREAFKARLGNCYRENALFVQFHDGTQLVHGSIQGEDHPRISHAWCVNEDGTVHDAVIGQDFPAIVYERLFNTNVDVTFTRDEVFTHLQHEKHWGPWTNE